MEKEKITQAIAEVLKNGADSIKKVVEEVTKRVPDHKPEEVLNQISTFITSVKKGVGKWGKAYFYDDTKFKIVPKKNSKNKEKTVLITGCSSGIGLATAVHLAKQGNKVYATMRDLNSKDKLMDEAAKNKADVQVLQLDVTEDTSVHAAVDQIVKKEGKVDILINNAGYGLMGPAETVKIEQAKAEFEVNFFGLLRVTQAVLPHMRKQKSGCVINISSIAGLRAMPASDLYNASKFAVEGLTEAMAPLMKLMGVNMCLVEPGPVSTDFNSRSLKWGSKQISDYEILKEKIKSKRRKMFEEAQQPIKIADLISDIINSEEPHLRYQTSEWVKEMASAKYRDLDGDKLVQEQVDRLKNG